MVLNKTYFYGKIAYSANPNNGEVFTGDVIKIYKNKLLFAREYFYEGIDSKEVYRTEDFEWIMTEQKYIIEKLRLLDESE